MESKLAEIFFKNMIIDRKGVEDQALIAYLTAANFTGQNDVPDADV